MHKAPLGRAAMAQAAGRSTAGADCSGGSEGKRDEMWGAHVLNCRFKARTCCRHCAVLAPSGAISELQKANAGWRHRRGSKSGLSASRARRHRGGRVTKASGREHGSCRAAPLHPRDNPRSLAADRALVIVASIDFDPLRRGLPKPISIARDGCSSRAVFRAQGSGLRCCIRKSCKR